MMILQNQQSIERNMFALFGLPVLEMPYGTGRNTGQLHEIEMKAIITDIHDVQQQSNYRVTLSVAYFDPGVPEITRVFGVDVYFDSPITVTDSPTFLQACETQILDFASSQSYSMGASDIIWAAVSVVPLGMKNAPQAAIANAPADATTNYNVVTTLLGTLTSAVNTANSKQNDIATKLNTLLSELRTLGLIST